MSLVKALEVWTTQGICDLGIILSIGSFLLYVGRPYFERVIGRLTLRVAADIWWLSYLVARDGALFLSAVIGLWTLNLDLMADIKIGLPFVPIATTLSAAALLWKVFGEPEERERSRKVSIALVSVAAFLNALGYALVMEAPGDEYRIAALPFWKTMVSLRSNANPELAIVTFFVSGAVLTVMAIAAIVASLRSRAANHVRS